MKVAINAGYGGFSISNKAIKRLAELNGRPCYFFSCDIRTGVYTPSYENDESMCVTAFDIPNPNEVLCNVNHWSEMTSEHRLAANEKYRNHHLESDPKDRTDANLIKVIEELGEEANGRHATLKIVEVPDDVQWEISDYDGWESVEEVHRSWS